MEAYAKVLLYVIPGFMVLIIIEAIYAYYKGDFNFRSMDTISSLSAGMTNILKSVLGLTVIVVSYEMMFNSIALIQIESTWLVYLLTFLALDFANYWYHRLAHSINIFWNRHVIHHSGEDFNLATALRQSMSKLVSITFIFLIPAALLGLPPKVIAIVTPFHLFLQFWYHTEHIGKLGFMEYIIVTPSQHRVHHAINPIYLDKNLSGIFCVWDRIFGTFQEELEEHPCVYGVTRQVKTWNPIKINFLHLWLLIKDALRAGSFVDKLRIWFMPTGWRPADVKEKHPIIAADVQQFVKYNPPTSTALKTWSWIQYFVLFFMIGHLLINIADIGSPGVFIYGGFLFLVIYSYTTLMDKDSNAIWLEAIKSIVGLVIIYQTGDWFLIDTLVVGGTALVAGYFIISALAVAYFVIYEIGWKEATHEVVGKARIE